MPPRFNFDPNTQRYRYTSGSRNGQFVSAIRVQQLTVEAIALVRNDINTIGELLIAGRISVATWERETAIALRHLHTWNYLLGRGGQSQMSQSDYDRLSREMRSQYSYLRGFSNDLISTGMTEQQFRARLQLYSEAARGTYEEARNIAHGEAGYSWEKRLRTKTESCDDCLRWAALRWQPFGTLPNRGERCECRARCGCYKIYAREQPRDFLTQRWGWLNSQIK